MAVAAKSLSPRDLCLVYSEADPRVSSIRLAERLDVRAAVINQWIERAQNKAELERYGPLSHRMITVRLPQGGSREAHEWLLNEDQATIVCMRSDADKAADARFEIVQLIRAYRRGEIPQTEITIIADLFDPRPAIVTPRDDGVTQIAFEKTANERFLDCIADDGPRRRYNPDANDDEPAARDRAPVPQPSIEDRKSTINYNDSDYDVTARHLDGSLFAFCVNSRGRPEKSTRLHVVGPDQKCVVVSIGTRVPLAAMLKALPPDMPAVSVETIKHFFADDSM